MVRFCWYDLYNVTFQLFYSTLSPLLLFYMCSYKIHRSHHLMVHQIPNTGSIFPQRSESLGKRWQSVHVPDIPAPRALCLTDGPRTHPEQWRWRSWGSCCAAPPSLCCFWHRFQSSQNHWTLGWWDWDELVDDNAQVLCSLAGAIYSMEKEGRLLPGYHQQNYWCQKTGHKTVTPERAGLQARDA